MSFADQETKNLFTDYRNGDFVVIDTETTGVVCWQDAILEVGAVRFRNWIPVAEYDQLVDPKIPPF